MATQRKGLKSVQVLKHRKMSASNAEQLRQKKLELAVRTELLHKLGVQLASCDKVMFEVDPVALPSFLVILEDPAVASLYDYEQESDSLFAFRTRSIL